ncbi:MAG: SOS response-associated peptidase [Bacteroidetes bacterium]|nr:SOS response-associated peptidase [Bacteroidota bacterium]
MCGRFSLTVSEVELNLRFELEGGIAPYESRYNCAPTQMLAVITNQNERQLSYLKWGLIPSWAKDPSIGNKMINARAETIAEKPSYRNPLRSQRCLIPSDGFYEWKLNGKKIPYRIFLKDTRIFSFAGIWEKWKSPDGDLVQTFTIITTSANEFMKSIHERMPVILNPEDEKRWLHETDHAAVMSLLKPCPPDTMDAYPVSDLVNSPRNEGPGVLERIGG